jgi:hypothetical protein
LHTAKPKAVQLVKQRLHPAEWDGGRMNISQRAAIFNKNLGGFQKGEVMSRIWTMIDIASLVFVLVLLGVFEFAGQEGRKGWQA